MHKKSQNFLTHLEKQFRSCSVCNSWWQPCEWICPTCHQKICHLLENHHRYVKGLSTQHLLVWNETNGNWVRPLIESLKGGFPSNELRTLLESDLTKRIQNSDSNIEPQKTYVVPAPSKKRGAKDHAFVLAQEYANILGYPLVNPLVRIDQGAQRGRSRQERTQIRVELDKNYKPEQFASAKIIWVDDVLTTGATAEACHKAMGSPKNFSVWTLAYRAFLLL